jgi:hypothetical protein
VSWFLYSYSDFQCIYSKRKKSYGFFRKKCLLLGFRSFYTASSYRCSFQAQFRQWGLFVFSCTPMRVLSHSVHVYVAVAARPKHASALPHRDETGSTWYIGHYWPIVPAPDDRWWMERELAEETEVLGENLPQGHYVRHKSHMTWPLHEPWPPRLEADD